VPEASIARIVADAQDGVSRWDRSPERIRGHRYDRPVAATTPETYLADL